MLLDETVRKRCWMGEMEIDKPITEPTRMTKMDDTLAPRLPLKSFPAGQGPAAVAMVQLEYGRAQGEDQDWVGEGGLAGGMCG